MNDMYVLDLLLSSVSAFSFYLPLPCWCRHSLCPAGLEERPSECPASRDAPPFPGRKQVNWCFHADGWNVCQLTFSKHMCKKMHSHASPVEVPGLPQGTCREFSRSELLTWYAAADPEECDGIADIPTRSSDILLWLQHLLSYIKKREWCPSIHFHYLLYLSSASRGGGVLEPSPAVRGWRQGDTLDKSPVFAGPRTDEHPLRSPTHTYEQLKVPNFPHVHVFGLLEEAREPEKNPHRHRKNLQTPHKKAPGLGSHQGLFLWGAALSTVPSCRPQCLICCLKWWNKNNRTWDLKLNRGVTYRLLNSFNFSSGITEFPASSVLWKLSRVST